MQKYAVLTLLLGLLLQAAPGHAAFVSAELRVNGLTCPFCAFGIEKKLLDVEGVREVQVFLDEGRIALTFDRENEATVGDLENAVEKAGFELAGLRLTVRGRLDAGADGRALLVANAGMSFRLAERRAERAVPVSTGTLERLRESAGQDGSMVVVGAVGERDEARPTLVVESAKAGTR